MLALAVIGSGLSLSAPAQARDLPRASDPPSVASAPWRLVPSRQGGVSRREWLELSRRLAAPWPRLQRRNGSYRDAFARNGSSRYGDAMLGYGLIQTGVRDRNRRLVRSGIRAVNAATRRVKPWTATRAFEAWAVAGAYNVARRNLGHWRSARQARRRWARWLRRQVTTHLQLSGFENKTLVDAVAVLEIQRTGLRSRKPGAILGKGRGRVRRRVIHLINRRVPAMVKAPGFVLSDPPTYPITYHALSYAAYARAVWLLKSRAGRGTAMALRQLGHTAWQATAPDGDVSYWGRSMGQSWALSAAAYGLAASAPKARPPWPQRYRSVAHRVLRRLQAYGVGPRGEWTTPSLRQDFRLASRSIDSYARATEYTGLTLVYLNLAIPMLPVQAALGTIASDAPSRAVLGSRQGRFAVVRQGNVWFAVREYGGRDLRYDFGPVAVKRLEAGAWRDVVPLRPRGGGTAGPVLLAGGARGAPVGSWLTTTGDGTVLIGGGFRTTRGRWLRRGVAFRIRPVACGVELSVGANARDRFEFSVFFRGRVARRLQPSTAAAASGQRAAFNPAFRQGLLLNEYSSASDAVLTRGRFLVEAPSRGQVSMAVC